MKMECADLRIERTLPEESRRKRDALIVRRRPRTKDGRLTLAAARAQLDRVLRK